MSLVEREVDAPLYWKAGTSVREGGRAAGYDTETRIRVNAAIAAYIHVSLDPERCDEGTCRVAGTAEEWVCSDRLDVTIDADVRTADGALAALASGYVLQGRAGFAFAETPAGTVFANLRDVTGTLELLPDDSPGIASAALLVDLFFKADHTEGDIRTHVRLETGECCARDYTPLFGHWPEPYPAAGPGSATPPDP